MTLLRAINTLALAIVCFVLVFGIAGPLVLLGKLCVGISHIPFLMAYGAMQLSRWLRNAPPLRVTRKPTGENDGKIGK